MAITPEKLAEHYPKLYHMAEIGSWNAILANGLLSTTALLDLFEITGDRRDAIELRHRPESVPIIHPIHGRATIRDQKPMRESALKACLIDMTPCQWYRFLNGRVFFWVTAERVQTLLNARAYRDQRHTVITIDTSTFVRRHANRVLLSPINSGSTIYKPVQRGAETFRPFGEYPFDERRKVRGLANAIAEVAVDYAVHDIRDLALKVELRQQDRILDVVFQARDH